MDADEAIREAIEMTELISDGRISLIVQRAYHTAIRHGDSDPEAPHCEPIPSARADGAQEGERAGLLREATHAVWWS
jgi:hypothetical protein